MAVNRSTTRIAPPQTGHCQTAVLLLADDTTVGGTGANNLRHSGNNSLRRRVASQPKQRMRGRPLGRTCCKKRSRRSSSVRVMARHLPSCT